MNATLTISIFWLKFVLQLLILPLCIFFCSTTFHISIQWKFFCEKAFLVFFYIIFLYIFCMSDFCPLDISPQLQLYWCRSSQYAFLRLYFSCPVFQGKWSFGPFKVCSALFYNIFFSWPLKFAELYIFLQSNFLLH